MAIQCQLYKNVSQNDYVHKNKTLLRTVNIELLNSFDVIRPTIRLQNNSNLFDTMKQCNYVYIPTLNRFYNCTFELDGKAWIGKCVVDVLQSNEQFIRESSGYILRQEHDYQDTQNGGIFQDPNYPIRSDVTVYPIPLKDSNGNLATVGSGHGYYLTVNGGFV